ncbi:hypothetical protein TOK_5158 [Pseudonocardia sp. N23]|nr:hypothetical protein TOK_5158 [Pseudonocardia sp. N23]
MTTVFRRHDDSPGAGGGRVPGVPGGRAETGSGAPGATLSATAWAK